MTTKHTPGPWGIESERHDYFIVAKGKTIAEIFSPFGNDCADARLIASAPDLMEALENMIETCEYGDHNADEYNAAVAAIAKAKGEAP